MAYLEINFDNLDDFICESGIEIAGGSLRLTNPNVMEPLAAYRKIEITDKIDYITVDCSFNPLVAGIPLWWGLNEPTFEQIKVEYSYLLSDLWKILTNQPPGIYYIGVLLGGAIAETTPYPANDPVAYWSMNDSVNESRNNGINGTWVGTAGYTDGMKGNAINLTGSNSVTVTNRAALQTGASQTISMWLYPTNFVNSRRNPWNKAYAGEGTITQETNGTLSYFYGTSGGDGVTYQGHSSGVLTLNSWNHVAIVRDLTAMKLRWYIGGLLSTEVNALYGFAQVGTADVKIGTGYAGAYVGRIDEVLLYNKALIASDILDLKNMEDKVGGLIPMGQTSISRIYIRYSTAHYVGNITEEYIYPYKGSEDRDTIIKINSIAAATNNYSNISVSQDRNPLPYLIVNEGDGDTELIIKTQRIKDNIVVSVSDTQDVSWNTQGLVGSGMDFLSSKRTWSRGNVVKGVDNWTIPQGAGFEIELDPLIPSDNVQLLLMIRKNSANLADVIVWNLNIGGDSIIIPFDDNDPYMFIQRQRFKKPNMPWLSNYVKFQWRLTDSSSSLFINDTLMYQTALYIEQKDKVLITNTSIKEGSVRSLYLGPLADGKTLLSDPDTVEERILVTGKVECMGSFFYAGSKILDAWAQIYLIDKFVYVNDELYGWNAGVELTSPVIIGVRDQVTNTETLYYGSQIDYVIYRYRGGYWSLYSTDYRLFSIWRSLHTEGLIVQKKDEEAVKIHLWKRDTNNELVWDKDLIFTGLPQTEHRLAPVIDRRTNQKTTPWVWAT